MSIETDTQNIQTYKVVSLYISRISYNDALSNILDLAIDKIPAYVCFANSHMTVESAGDQNFSKDVNSAKYVLPDGVPIKAAMNFFYKINQERIPGMDFLPDFINRANKSRFDVFILGSSINTINAVINTFNKKFININVVGSISPPFNKNWDNNDYVETINKASPNLVLVALGCPKQEKWMATYSSRINAVLLGIGGALPVFAGIAKNSPLWMKNNGLEWLFRLIQEPKRLWKRYLITNTLILWLLLKQLLSRRK